MTDLNMSDHLPLVAELTIECPARSKQTQPDTCNNLHPCVDWEQATKSGDINKYHWQQLSELNSHACLEGMEDIEAAISLISDTLKDAAAKSLPEKCY